MTESSYRAHATAVVDQPCTIGKGTRIWHFCHVMRDVDIGENCVFGQNCFVASGVKVGHNVRVQNNVSLYTGVIVEDDVFLGPSCVLTNVINPRSEIDRKSEFRSTLIRRGATIGANATIVCGITIGRFAFVGAGAVIRQNVPDYALMLGVPADRKGWMSRHGHRLRFEGDEARCPESGLRYRLQDQRVECLDVDADAPLPAKT